MGLRRLCSRESWGKPGVSYYHDNSTLSFVIDVFTPYESWVSDAEVLMALEQNLIKIQQEIRWIELHTEDTPQGSKHRVWVFEDAAHASGEGPKIPLCVGWAHQIWSEPQTAKTKIWVQQIQHADPLLCRIWIWVVHQELAQGFWSLSPKWEMSALQRNLEQQWPQSEIEILPNRTEAEILNSIESGKWAQGKEIPPAWVEALDMRSDDAKRQAHMRSEWLKSLGTLMITLLIILIPTLCLGGLWGWRYYEHQQVVEANQPLQNKLHQLETIQAQTLKIAQELEQPWKHYQDARPWSPSWKRIQTCKTTELKILSLVGKNDPKSILIQGNAPHWTHLDSLQKCLGENQTSYKRQELDPQGQVVFELEWRIP